MKKLLFLLSFVLVYLTSIGQTILTESFDGTTFVPTGWSVVTTSTSATWARVTTSAHPTGITPHSGAGMARFNSWSYSTGVQSIITPVFDLSGRGTSPTTVSFWIYRESGFSTSADKVDVLVNTVPSPIGATLLGTINRSRTLAPVVSANNWYQYTYNIPATFNSTSNYILFRATSAYGNDIHIDDIQWIEYKKPCSGMPIAGNIIAPPSVCSGTPFTLSLSGYTIAPGITFQWQSKSSFSTTWSNIVGATSTNYTTSINAYTDYRCVVTCTSSNQSAITSLVSVTLNFVANMPLTVGDSVCPGQTAVIKCYWKDTSVIHKWYYTATSTSPFYSGDTVIIPSVMKDTTLYVRSVDVNSQKCQSQLVPVNIYVGNPPVVDLGVDLNVCQMPLIIDAGQYGASSYLWNTGETSQYIIIRDPGTYWVQVDRYCKGSDTVNITFDPPASCSGISYTRIGDKFIFSPANPNYTTKYLWSFSDGTQQQGATATKTITFTTRVRLAVSNDCGGDTVYLDLFPTSIDNTTKEHELFIYPNPTTGKFTIDFNQSEEYSVYVTNAIGTVIKKPESNIKVIDISEQTSGVYTIHIKTKNMHYTTKIVKSL
jgi:hypothetical protein